MEPLSEADFFETPTNSTDREPSCDAENPTVDFCASSATHVHFALEFVRLSLICKWHAPAFSMLRYHLDKPSNTHAFIQWTV